MYLSQLALNVRSRLVQRDLADCQDMHRTIMGAFPPTQREARAQFGVLHRVDADATAGPILLVQSRERPDWTPLPQGYLAAPPRIKDIREALGAFKADQLLAFRLRANPTRKIDTKSTGDTHRNGRRVELRTDEQRMEWLRRKSEAAGFEVVSVRVRDGESHGHRATDAGKGSLLTFASVVFDGMLRVRDVEQLRRALSDGIGSAKAYGHGLLSLASVPGGPHVVAGSAHPAEVP